MEKNVSIRDVIIENCVCLNGSGGGIYVSVEDGYEVEIQNVSVKGCRTNNGKGGGVYGRIGGEEGVGVIGFEGCEFIGIEGDGNIKSRENIESIDGGRVYIECREGDISAKKCKWSSLGDYSSLREMGNEMWVEDMEGREGVNLKRGEAEGN